MVAEHTEHACILVGQMLLNRIAHIDTLSAKTQSSAHLLVHANIEFCDVNTVYHLLV